jgi:NMD protein affecting ribosome stability and mRNA decay
MAANQHCMNCGAKGRTTDGLCPDCYLDELEEALA